MSGNMEKDREVTIMDITSSDVEMFEPEERLKTARNLLEAALNRKASRSLAKIQARESKGSSLPLRFTKNTKLCSLYLSSLPTSFTLTLYPPLSHPFEDPEAEGRALALKKTQNSLQMISDPRNRAVYSMETER